MKIISVDNNYGEGAGEPAWFLLTHSCLQRDNKPLYVPGWDTDFRLFPSMAIRLERLGKSIPERFAHRYWSHYSFGFSLRGMDTVRRCLSHGLPQGAGVAFDNSAVIAPDWFEADRDSLNLNSFSVCDDETELMRWDYSRLALGADALVARLSRLMTMKTGDILYLGFPSEGIPLRRDMKIVVNEHIKEPEGAIIRPVSRFRLRIQPPSDI